MWTVLWRTQCEGRCFGYVQCGQYPLPALPAGWRTRWRARLWLRPMWTVLVQCGQYSGALNVRATALATSNVGGTHCHRLGVRNVWAGPCHPRRACFRYVQCGRDLQPSRGHRLDTSDGAISADNVSQVFEDDMLQWEHGLFANVAAAAAAADWRFMGSHGFIRKHAEQLCEVPRKCARILAVPRSFSQ